MTVFADALNEGLLASAKATGTTIYFSCILTPPTSDEQTAYCIAMSAVYKAKSQTLNAPLPLMIGKDPSPYSWSPYDICRFEVGHLIFGKQSEVPYCPTAPTSLM